jgi:hypothetical protein
MDTTAPKIRVSYVAIDGYRQTRSFTTPAAARRFAQRWIGEGPEMGQSYAISGDGVGRITVTGMWLADLFPAAQRA